MRYFIGNWKMFGVPNSLNILNKINLFNSKDKNRNKYRVIILMIIVLGLLFLIATSGRYILPQILQLIKIGLPFLTKFIGI